MITNQPSPLDFEKQSVEYLVQFFNLIIDKEEPWNRTGISDEPENFWEYHQVVLKSALTLLFLALENQLKKKICEVSPFLLLSDNPSEWRTQNRDKPFYEFHIRPFDDLLTLYLEIENQELSQAVLQQFDNLRKKRNLITHALYEEHLHPSDLFSDLAIIVVNVWGVNHWWTQYTTYVREDPEFGIYDSEKELAWLSHNIEYLIDNHGLRPTGIILGIDFSARRYFCPECHIHLNSDSHDYDYKHSVLSPNQPNSTNIVCGSCQKNFDVGREDCSGNDCPGNVIYELRDSTVYEDSHMCLTCGCLEPIE